MVLLSASSPNATPIPRKVLAVVLIVQFAEAFQLSVLFPFVPFMVASFEGVGPEDVGPYSGFLAAAFVLGQLLSSFPWGMLSDRYGEKVIVLISLCLTFVSSLFFGFCTEFWQAYLARFLAGLFNGNIGVIKTYLGKNTDSTNQGTAFGLVSAAWVIGCIVAPVIGGFLAQPALLYPGVFPEDGFFGKFPFVLPSLITSVVLLISWVASLLLIEDEKFPEDFMRSLCRRAADGILHYCSCLCGGKVVPKTRRFRKPGLHKKTSEATYHIALHNDSDDSEVEIDLSSNFPGRASEEEEEELRGQGSREKRTVETLEMTARNHLGEEDSEDGEGEDPVNERAATKKPATEVAPPAPVKLTKQEFRFMLFSAAMYSAVCFLFIALDETFPLYCRSPPEEGGLGFQTNQIGTALSGMGVVELLYIFFMFPWVNRTFDDMKIFRWSLVIFVPVIASYPLSNLLVGKGVDWALWLFLFVNLGLRGISSTNVFTPVMIFINNSVPKQYMGRANGFGQAFAAGNRAIGPPLAGYLWSITSEAQYFLHSGTVFFLMALFALVILALSWVYPKGIELAYEERKQEARNQDSEL